MTVQVRLNRGKHTAPRTRRAGGEGHSRTGGATEPIRQRHGGPSQDRALYTCSCGYVFEAQVSTSVGCPHCGGTQAW
ncbi:MAG TPA: hypothetical protein VG275_10540 [Solirubrobacteraceae bacterium]|jgi:hypothetical protein|nr:hypothetical protein [Solirubrobacteraceae bacterium]